MMDACKSNPEVKTCDSFFSRAEVEGKLKSDCVGKRECKIDVQKLIKMGQDAKCTHEHSEFFT